MKRGNSRKTNQEAIVDFGYSYEDLNSHRSLRRREGDIWETINSSRIKDLGQDIGCRNEKKKTGYKNS